MKRTILVLLALTLVASSAHATIWQEMLETWLISIVDPNDQYDPDETGTPWEPPCGDCARELPTIVFYMVSLPPWAVEKWHQISEKSAEDTTAQERESLKLRDAREKLPPDLQPTEYIQVPGTCEFVSDGLA